MAPDKKSLPAHVAITMDGNGRWATKRNLSRTAGHKEGLKTAKTIVRTAADLGIKCVTLYVFSTENWRRAQEEVGFLMNLIHTHLVAEFDFYRKNGIRVRHIGNPDGLPQQVLRDIKAAEESTAGFNGLTLNLAINYGGRDEILRGARKAISSGIPAESLTEDIFSGFLDIPDYPDVDLLIRTGGEFRLSNYLLWHIPYAEHIYTGTLWPDYSPEEFINNIEEYKHRNRRFGAEKSVCTERTGAEK